MMNYITDNEAAIRLAFFIGIFVVVACIELVAPRRPLTTSKPTRWFGNIGIVVINTVLLRFLKSVCGIVSTGTPGKWSVMALKRVGLVCYLRQAGDYSRI